MTLQSLKFQRALWCSLFIASALMLSACVENGETDPDPICISNAVQAMNPQTGNCEWVSSCDLNGWTVCADDFTCEDLPADACGLDARCATEVRSVCNDCAEPAFPGDEQNGSDIIACGCFDTTACVTVTPDLCGNLGEAACLASPACDAQFGWMDGSGSAGDPIDGAPRCIDGPDGTRCGDVPFFQEWGFLGCFPTDPLPCANLDEASCSSNSQCEPIYEFLATPCYCDPGYFEDTDGDGLNDVYCDCGGGIPVFAGCQESRPSCGNIGSPDQCYSTPGCRWEGGLGEVDVYPCDCAGLDCQCPEMPMPIEPGACVDDTIPPSCYDIADEYSCWNAGCEWNYDGAGVPTPMPDPYPCDCAPDDVHCACAGKTAPEYWGYCQPPTTNTCYDLWDVSSCLNAGCEWISDGTQMPEPYPCDCAPDDQNCVCAGFAPIYGFCQPPTTTNDCWNNYDEYSCSSNPDCEWFYGDAMPPYPCDCDPSMPDCGCGTGLVAVGWCEQRYEPTCYDLYDPMSCSSNPECQWYDGGTGADPMPPFPCDCIPEDPNCVCAGERPAFYGWCEYKTTSSCEQTWDEYSCISTPGCEWLYDFYPAPDCNCDPADATCMQDCGMGVPYPGGTCVTAAKPTQCFDYFDEYSCISDPSCGWTSNGAGAPAPPICECLPGDVNCACDPIDCWGAWTDANGLCRTPSDGIYPDYCCGTVVDYGFCEPLTMP